MFNVIKTKFGDQTIVFTQDEQQDSKEFVTFEAVAQAVDWTKAVIVKGCQTNPDSNRLSLLLPSTSKYGLVFGNTVAQKSFPYVESDVIQSAGVIPILSLGSLGQWVVLLKSKGCARLHGALGMKNGSDKSTQDTARRCLLEETGLSPKTYESLRTLAKLTFQQAFVSLEFKGESNYFFCSEWTENKRFQEFKKIISNKRGDAVAIYVPFENNETETLLLVNIEMLSLFEMPSELDGLKGMDADLVNEAVKRSNSLTYITSFQWM